MLDLLLRTIKPWARSLKYNRLLRRAKSDAANVQATPLAKPVGFIFGCGRSGTTVLGKLLNVHPNVHYLREPYHIWRAIDPSTDMVQLFGDANVHPRCMMSSEFATTDAIQKFNACMQAEQNRGGLTKQVIEKTPIQAMRIGFINGCSPNSPLLHMVRNGLDVVRSIDGLAKDTAFGTAGKGTWNRWWGRDSCKMYALARDAIASNWYSEEIPALKSDLEMGALEWLLSLGEIEKNAKMLSPRLLEVKYCELTHDPYGTLTKICDHFRIEPTKKWLSHGCNTLEPARKNDGDPLVLPPAMCAAFNAFQAKYDFDGQAVEG